MLALGGRELEPHIGGGDYIKKIKIWGKKLMEIDQVGIILIILWQEC